MDVRSVVHDLDIPAELQVGGPGAIRTVVRQRPLVGGEQEPGAVRRHVHRHHAGDRRDTGDFPRPENPSRRFHPHHLPVPDGALDDRHRYCLEMAAQPGHGPGQIVA
ncbi:hypothetical protein D3C86_1855010 [compost metagenome]